MSNKELCCVSHERAANGTKWTLTYILCGRYFWSPHKENQFLILSGY